MNVSKTIKRMAEIYIKQGKTELLNRSNRALMNKLSYYYGTKIRSNISRNVDSIPPDPYRVLWVNPKNIEFKSCSFNPNPNRYGGKHSRAYYMGSIIKDGDWDKDLIPVNSLPKYKAVILKYKKGLDWEKTGIYEYMMEQISLHGSYDGCSNMDDVVDRYTNIDRLYSSIKQNGYLTNKCGNLDHICVNIGRSGEILFNGNGQHRLAISKVLNIEKIPVRVLVRHTDWAEKRRNIWMDNNKIHSDNSNEDTKEYHSHPDICVLV